MAALRGGECEVLEECGAGEENAPDFVEFLRNWLENFARSPNLCRFGKRILDIMIREFWVENYMSIAQKQSLSFLSKGPESALVSEIAGEFLYKLAILFGPNASGKSNMLWSLHQVFGLLVLPRQKPESKVPNYYPFALLKDKPTRMFVSFYADEIRYDYEISFDETHILSERLDYYPNRVKSLFYERIYAGENIQAEIKFGQSLHILAKTQESVRENVFNNHSVLSVCAKKIFKDDIEPFTKLYSWIMTHYHNVDEDNDKGPVEMLKEAFSDEKKHSFFCQMLKRADLNIVGFHTVVRDRRIPQSLRDEIMKETLPEQVKESLLRPTEETIVFDNASAEGLFEIPFDLQSNGTVKFIRILDKLYDMVTGQHVYYLDELGEDLHYDLLFYYLNVFLYNSSRSQLLITSQETALLNQDIINDNRAVVWFVEKKKETASSEYNRGDSFGLHKNLSLYNSYRIGRLGAKPELGSIFLDYEE